MEDGLVRRRDINPDRDSLLGRSGLDLLRPLSVYQFNSTLLLALALFTALAWSNFFAGNRGQVVHDSEFFHYYLGARYFEELGYSGLYDCAALAELELGTLDDPARRALTDLRTDLPVLLSQHLPAINSCGTRFSVERWKDFKSDVNWFRARLSPAEWQAVQLDHGFNASPVWLIAGSTLAKFLPLADSSVRLIIGLDYLLLMLGWLAVLWAFGLRTGSLALIAWSFLPLSSYGWVGGSFLRHDWFACLLIGISCLRKNFWFGAGVFLCYSGLLRMFPLLVVATTAAHLWWQGPTRRFQFFQFIMGGAATALILLSVSTYMVGMPAWQAFAKNSEKHLDVRGGNSVSAETVTANLFLCRSEDHCRLTESRSTDPFVPLKALLDWGLLILVVVLWWIASSGSPSWIAAIYALGVLPFATSLSCYYYAVWALWALCFPARKLLTVALFVLLLLLNGLAVQKSVGNLFYLQASVIVALFSLAALATAALPTQAGRKSF